MVELIEIVEGSSSSSSSTAVHRHDVFISFRGLDTRNSFTNHLHKALKHANITTFYDDEKIRTGEDLKPELENAIKESRASIIVLSKNYANSSWCLDELVLILEQRLTSNQIVIPIFYHVEPTHVRKQQSSFGDAMIEHKQRMEAETNANKRSQLAQKIDRWIQALTEVANLKGKDVNGRLETEFIDEIVTDIYRRLHVPLSCTLPQLVGMESSIRFVTSWLKDDSSHSGDILTIFGMGGIGKTSLAKYVYLSHFREFDTSSYVEDISRRCAQKFNGVLDLQRQLYGDMTRTTPIGVHDGSMCTSQIESVIGGKKVFIVLDDIDSLEQLNALLGSRGFHQGSKIIITTKNTWLTESCKLVKTNVKPKLEKYELNCLCEAESQKLLCNHAFLCDDPKEGYEEVSKGLVKYCEGHPLALEVLGNSLYNRDVAYWEECLEGLKKEIDHAISNVLRMSFDSLPSENDKELFKYIACFFVGEDRDVTATILKACDINTRFGITNLIDRCLLSIGYDNELKMHQLIQEMGRFIVRQESPDKPWKRSRLWCHKESFKVLKQKKGTENIRGLTLDMRVLEKEKAGGSSFTLKTDALSKMDNLMLLQLNYVQMNGSYNNFPEELRWLCMQGFSLKFMPVDLPMENLVALDMSYSNLESFGICYNNPKRKRKRLESRGKLIGSLKILNLSFCEQLRSVGGFVQLPSLERLILRNCISLVEVCESIEQCVDLVLVDMSYCNKLENRARTISMLKSVRTLLLEGCDLGETLDEMNDMDSLEMIKPDRKTSSSMVLEVIPSNLNFVALSLPKNLVSLSLAYCNLSTESFPMDFNCLSVLKELYLDENPIVSLPNCVRSLPRLKLLSIYYCAMLTSIEHPPPTLTDLILDSNSDDLIKKVVFDPQMSPLGLSSVGYVMSSSSFEFQGVVKIQPMIGVEEKVLHSLGWNNLDFLHEKRVQTTHFLGNLEESEIQMYYEFGIFSTIYGGEEMPKWVSHRSKGSSISFTIPSSPNNLTGLNFCYVLTFPDLHESRSLPLIIISNITKNRTWIYEHYIDRVSVGGEYSLTFLSHWMFTMNEMETGDQATITAVSPNEEEEEATEECGVNLVYDDGNTDEEEEEDALGYYKSWNHIIGGDLTGFQTTTGEYILDTTRFMQKHRREVNQYYSEVVGEGARYKEEKVWFRALSRRKSDRQNIPLIA